MTLIPTLKLFCADDDLPGILNEVGGYQRMGGQILFGTDVGYLPDYDPSNEYSLMSRAGLTPMQILASLTTAPADRFSESDSRGRLAAGTWSSAPIPPPTPPISQRSATQFEPAASCTLSLRTNPSPSKYIYGYCLA